MKNPLSLFKSTKAKPLVEPDSGQATNSSGKAAGGKSAPENPYIEARREWNERYGDYISQARNWRYAAFFCCLVSLVSAGGVGYIGAQSKIVPYVVEVDKFGSAIAVGPADKASMADQKVIKAFLARFIIDWRTLTVDRVAQKDAVVRLYSMLPVGANSQRKMNDYFQENNPFVRLQRGTTQVEVTSVLPISEKTWQVEWNEINRDLKGAITSKVRFKASTVVGLTPPTEERQIIANPLGVYIIDFNVAQQL